MVTDLKVIQNKPAVSASAFSPSQIEIIKSQIAKNCSDDELNLFMAVCQKTGLDPFSKQIYAIKRKSKNDDGTFGETMTIQTGIDGLRVLAQRGGRYRGQTLPLFCGVDGKWTEVWLENTPPVAAKVGVFVDGVNEPVYAIALYKTYVQTTKYGVNSMWAKMPEVLLAKCAEALALRKACPFDTSHLYIAEEMGQAERPPENVFEGTDGRTAIAAVETRVEKDPGDEIYSETPGQMRRFHAKANQFGVHDETQIRALSKATVGVRLNDVHSHLADLVHNLRADIQAVFEGEAS